MAAAVLGHYPGAQPLYDLIVGCLEHRLGDEVRLGQRAGLSAVADDDVEIEVIDAD